MKRNILKALSMLLCMSALSLMLTACGSDNEPNLTQEFYVRGAITEQYGTFMGGETGISGFDENSPEFKFYKAIYEEVKTIIKAQTWVVNYKQEEKAQKIKEQNEIAEKRFSEMVRALEAVQKKLDAADKNAYKCHFAMTVKMVAVGENEIRSGQKTISFEGNE